MSFEDWATTAREAVEDRFRPSLVARARKRVVQQIGPNSWIVSGNSSLGDQYESYGIKWRPDSGKYRCECQLHRGGEYRKMCSHIVGVMLYREENPNAEPESSQDTIIDESHMDEKRQERHKRAREIVSERLEGQSAAEVAQLRPTAYGAFEEAPLPQHPVFGNPLLPDKYEEFRPQQWEAVVEILDHLNDGIKVVMLDAPTGAGKTLIGEVVRRLYTGEHLPATYMCATKTLQAQVLEDFPYARMLKGRNNYTTLERVDLTAEDCIQELTTLPACVNCPSGANGQKMVGEEHFEQTKHCFWCHPFRKCPYQAAKAAAMEAPLSILNIAYFLAETQGYGSAFFGRELVVVDEADILEGELLRHIEIKLSPSFRKSIGVTTLPLKTVEEDWTRWIRDDVIPGIEKALDKMKGSQQELAIGIPPDPKKRRRLKNLQDTLAKFKALIKDIEIENLRTGEMETMPEIEAGWIYKGYEGKDESPDEIWVTFQPVRVGRLARKAIWENAKSFLLMTATPVSSEQMADDLGLEDGEWAAVEMTSTFPVERRPIIVQPVANMTYKTRHTAWPQMVKGIDELIAQHPDQRVLVHTVSYKLTKYIYEHSISDRMMTYWRAAERDKTLNTFLTTEDGVLLAPSFERGIDLPQEDCRLIIIAKVPYPATTDKRVAKRMHQRGGPQWYAVQTIRALAQMTGRGMRSANDFCKSIILDGQFRRFYGQNKKLFPTWWREALILGTTDPKAQRRLAAVLVVEEELRNETERRLGHGRRIRVAEENDGNRDQTPLPDPF